MKYLLGICLLLSGFLVFGQHTETRKTDQFYDLSIQGPFKVELIRGDKNEIFIHSDDISLDEIITDSRGKELIIKLNSRTYLKEKYYDADYINVRLTYTDLEDVKISMGSQLKMRETFVQDYFRIESTMGAEAELNIDVEELYGKASMGGIIEISGKVLYAEVIASMGGEFQGSELEANRADIRSGMGGFVTIEAKDRLRGSASMGGVIRYTGNADSRNTNTVLGGEIHRHKGNN